MLNGLLILYGNKNRMSGLVYRLLHDVLTEDGVYTQGKPGNDIRAVLEAIQIRSRLKVHHYDDVAVANALRKLTFDKQVAICVVNSGTHAILLTGKTDGWYHAFDPDWDGVKRKQEFLDAYITQPEVGRKSMRGKVNLLIEENYLLRSRGGKRGGNHLGAVCARTLTVIEKH
ncbi:MAG: hypothetical protein KKA63_10795 [Gammaproteobacteria bacterium]|nr:hypothetical protein [Gammaproteobacteria bacterium]